MSMNYDQLHMMNSMFYKIRFEYFSEELAQVPTIVLLLDGLWHHSSLFYPHRSILLLNRMFIQHPLSQVALMVNLTFLFTCSSSVWSTETGSSTRTSTPTASAPWPSRRSSRGLSATFSATRPSWSRSRSGSPFSPTTTTTPTGLAGTTGSSTWGASLRRSPGSSCQHRETWMTTEPGPSSPSKWLLCHSHYRSLYCHVSYNKCLKVNWLSDIQCCSTS